MGANQGMNWWRFRALPDLPTSILWRSRGAPQGGGNEHIGEMAESRLKSL